MDELAGCYVRMLHLGFISLRRAIETGNLDWARAEMELLHNIPSLLDEDNRERHRFFWTKERDYYLDWVANCAPEEAKSLVRTLYEPLWEEMEPLMANRLQPQETEVR